MSPFMPPMSAPNGPATFQPSYTVFAHDYDFANAGSYRITMCRNEGIQKPSDVNQDGALDLSDAVALLGFLFLGTPELLPCGDGEASDPGNITLLDENGDGGIDISDAVGVLGFLYSW